MEHLKALAAQYFDGLMTELEYRNEVLLAIMNMSQADLDAFNALFIAETGK